MGCQCFDGCTDSNQSDCVVKNGGIIPFNSKGAILKAKTLIQECGPSCKCPPSCPNRVVPLHPPPGDTSTERSVHIDGTPEQIEAAKQLVNEAISESPMCLAMSRGCRNLLNLPRDITIMILQKVGILEILMSAQFVCTEWHQIICTDPTICDVVKAAKSALRVEHTRLQKLTEIDEENRKVRRSTNKDFSSNERHISRLITQIRGIKDNVDSKASDIVKILKDPNCPQPISIATLANKVVSRCDSGDNAPFASAYVIVLVASQVPYAMDIVLAEFHRACIFTVPKYITYSKAVFKSREEHYKSLGFREDDGNIETVPDYLKRLESYMTLYGALVQTEADGVPNPHGLTQGWAWLARFLNALPPDLFTATALNSFLQVAGYALFKRYKSQFMKILNVISKNYVGALRKREDPELNPVIAEIESYIQDRKFLQVPEGKILQTSLQSRAAPGLQE